MTAWWRRGSSPHFAKDGPSTFAQMRALFPAVETRRVIYAEPDRRKLRISRYRLSQVQAMADRILRRVA